MLEILVDPRLRLRLQQQSSAKVHLEFATMAIIDATELVMFAVSDDHIQRIEPSCAVWRRFNRAQFAFV